ncbi:Spindle assembly checkpoint component mad1 [Leucoagaricus sp. SymC.cos]|nr:Spindle assembly checkpoint component mad1 [Leucoagaricus sp. SymC.cos]
MSSDENAPRTRRPLRAAASASSAMPMPSSRTMATAVKRDSLAAELERDPQFSTAKRHHRTQLFTNSISHASLERQLLQAQTARIDLETKLREKELAVERLERDRRHFADREREEREAREQLEAGHNAYTKQMEAECKSLRTQVSDLQETNADLQNTHSQLSLSTAQTISSQKSLLNSLTPRASLLESELAAAQSLASSRLESIHSLQDQLDELQEAKDEWTRGVNDQQDLGVVREELKRQAEYLRQLEGTNARLNVELVTLRNRHASIEVLREQNSSLESKLAYTESLRQKVASLEAELEAARQERETWASTNTSIQSSQPSTPSKAPTISETHSLTSLRLSHATLLEQHGSTLATLRTLESSNADLSSQLAESTSLCSSLKEELKAEKEGRRKDDVRARLAEHEVGFLKALVASYQAEELTMDELKVDELKVQRINDLEALLSDYKSTLASLPSPSTTPPSSPSKPSQPSPLLLAELESLKSKFSDAEKTNEEHLETIDKLEQELFELSGEIAGGRHVPPKTRILQLVDNPEQQWFDLRQSMMDKLKEENSALLKRLHDLESSLPSHSTSTTSPDPSQPPATATLEQRPNEELVPRASYDLLQSTNTSLQSELSKKEKRLLRLTQVFHSKATEFREAIAAILGVKLAFYPNGQVRATSMFDLNASFVFQPVSNGTGSNGGNGGGGGEMKMQLVAQGEGGPQDLPSLMRYWIENEQCPPGFMASVTLECYEKAKAEVEASGGNGAAVAMGMGGVE